MVAKKALPTRGQRTATNKATQPTIAPVRPASSMRAEEKKWQARDDLHTLKRAAEIQSDPSRMKAAKSEAQQQMKMLQTVAKK